MLRDTFATQLLSNGVALTYVSAALGHSTVSVTSQHYVKWCGTESYREPVRLAEGETPADLIAKLGEKVTPEVTPDAAESN